MKKNNKLNKNLLKKKEEQIKNLLDRKNKQEKLIKQYEINISTKQKNMNHTTKANNNKINYLEDMSKSYNPKNENYLSPNNNLIESKMSYTKLNNSINIKPNKKEKRDSINNSVKKFHKKEKSINMQKHYFKSNSCNLEDYFSSEPEKSESQKCADRIQQIVIKILRKKDFSDRTANLKQAFSHRQPSPGSHICKILASDNSGHLRPHSSDQLGNDECAHDKDCTLKNQDPSGTCVHLFLSHYQNIDCAETVDQFGVFADQRQNISESRQFSKGICLIDEQIVVNGYKQLHKKHEGGEGYQNFGAGCQFGENKNCNDKRQHYKVNADPNPENLFPGNIGFEQILHREGLVPFPEINNILGKYQHREIYDGEYCAYDQGDHQQKIIGGETNRQKINDERQKQHCDKEQYVHYDHTGVGLDIA